MTKELIADLRAYRTTGWPNAHPTICDQAADTLQSLSDTVERLAEALRQAADDLQRLRAMPGNGGDGRLWQRIDQIRDDARAALAAHQEHSHEQ